MNVSTKTLLINLAGLAVSLAGLILLIMSAIFYNSATNLSTDFLTIAFTLMIIAFALTPLGKNKDSDDNS